MLFRSDAANRYYFAEVETLGALAGNEEFETYSTFGWRRLGLLRALPSNFVSLGPLAYLFENPHALVSALCILSSVAAFGLAALLWFRLPRRRAAAEGERFPVRVALDGEGVEA